MKISDSGVNKLKNTFKTLEKIKPTIKRFGTEENPRFEILQSGTEITVLTRDIIDTSMDESFSQTKPSPRIKARLLALGLPHLNWMEAAGLNIKIVGNNLVDGSRIPRLDNLDVSWLAENDAPPGDANPAISSEPMHFKRATAYVDVTRHVLKGNLLDVDEFLMLEIGRAISASIANKVLVGDALENEIDGIANRTGVDSQDASLSTTQGALSTAILEISLNAGRPNLIIANPTTRNILQNMLWEFDGTTDTGSRGLWSYDFNSPTGESCMGIPATLSGEIPDGTAIVGDFNSLRVYAHEETDFIVHTVGKASVDGSTRIVAHSFADILLRPEHFSLVSGIL